MIAVQFRFGSTTIGMSLRNKKDREGRKAPCFPRHHRQTRKVGAPRTRKAARGEGGEATPFPRGRRTGDTRRRAPLAAQTAVAALGLRPPRDVVTTPRDVVTTPRDVVTLPRAGTTTMTISRRTGAPGGPARPAAPVAWAGARARVTSMAGAPASSSSRTRVRAWPRYWWCPPLQLSDEGWSGVVMLVLLLLMMAMPPLTSSSSGATSSRTGLREWIGIRWAAGQRLVDHATSAAPGGGAAVLAPVLLRLMPMFLLPSSSGMAPTR